MFNSERNFSEEQAVELCEFLDLTELESDYFLALVQLARAGSRKLELKIAKQLSRLRENASEIKSRVPKHQEMDESAKAQFYSNWYYSGIRLATDIEGLQNQDSLAEALGLSRRRVQEVIEFLLRYGLCISLGDRLKMGQKRTHIDAQSPFTAAHHRNWRLKGFENLDHIDDDELFFTGPMTLSLETLREIRFELTELLARTTKKIEPSRSEVLACLNFDLFKVRR